MKPDPSIGVVLARNVRRLRERQDLSADALAERLGISASRVAAIERGDGVDVRIGLVEAIALVFEVGVDELLTPRKARPRKRGASAKVKAKGARVSRHRVS
jgi:transcriptional regulator with XRE-family HTH domain